MSFDLILWAGSPAEPSRYWSAIEHHDTSALPVLPTERVVAAIRGVFGGDVRVWPAPDRSAGVEIQGRGWECAVDGVWAAVKCHWSVANDAEAIARLVKAAHAAGCSIYDPQFGAYWPASIGLPEGGADAWRAACFDQGFIYEDEQDEKGHVPSTSMHLCPDDASPIERRISLYLHVVEQGPLVRALVSSRAGLYRERFPGWTMTVELGGPGAGAIASSADCARWLKLTNATPVLAPDADRPSIAFVVLGYFDARVLVDRLDFCPFELVPFSEEEKTLASIFGEPVASLAVVVPARISTGVPETLRSALHVLGETIASLTGGAPVHFADPSQPADANVGANMAWVEALVGLTPSEPIRAVAAADVPLVVIDGDDTALWGRPTSP